MPRKSPAVFGSWHGTSVVPFLSHIALGLLLLGLPGYAVACVLRPRDTGLDRFGMALAAGPVVIGLLTITVALLSNSVVTLWHIVVFSVGTVGGCWRCMQRPVIPQADRMLIGLGLLCGAFFLVHYDRELFQFNCVNQAASLLLGEGERPDWAADLDYLLAGNRNVRLGNVSLVAPTFVLFGFLGPRLLYAWLGAALFIWGAILGRRAFPERRYSPLLMGLFLALNPYVLGIPILDENLFAALGTTLLLASLAAERRSFLWMGLVLGLLVGVRHIALLLCPGLFWILWRTRPSGRQWLVFFGALVAVGALWAFHHERVFGSPFGFESFEEYHADHPHQILGMEFGFRGLLNAPFHDQWVRTPYNAYPSALLLLFWVLNRFGLLLCALIPIGLLRLRHHPLLSPGRLMGVSIPVVGLLLVLENTMQPNKMGLFLMVLPCLVLMIVAGVLGLSRRTAPIALLTMAVLALSQWFAAAWNVPADARVYSVDSDAVRQERGEYLDWERAHLVRHNWWPDFSRVAEYSRFEPLRKLSDAWFDLSQRTGVRPVPRPPTEPLAIHDENVVLALDFSKVLIGREDWVSETSQPPHWRLNSTKNMEKSAFDLGTLPWAEYPAYVGVAQNLESGFVRIYLEFGAFHTFPDLPPEEETAVTAVEGATLRIAVPRHTRVEVTEVVADQFSRYYRWRILAGPTVKVDAEPSIVFTN